MSITGREAREEIIEDLGVAVERTELALARLGEAYEQLSVTAGERLEDELFRPVQRGLGHLKRTRTRFASQHGIEPRPPEQPSPGPPSTGARGFVEGAVAAAASADQRLGELQDGGHPVEFGDPELRAGIADARASLDQLARPAARFLNTLGR